MRVRRKDGYAEAHDVREESPSYYIGVDFLVYSKLHYEPIPEPRWVDVSGNVVVREMLMAPKMTHPDQVYVNSDHVATLHCSGRYRLVKERLWRINFGAAVDAFRIERREDA